MRRYARDPHRAHSGHGGSADRLSKYYGSDQWYDDRAVDDAGKLPADLKRGVLTEDLIYDVLVGNRENAIRMLELGTEILKRL